MTRGSSPSDSLRASSCPRGLGEHPRCARAARTVQLPSDVLGPPASGIGDLARASPFRPQKRHLAVLGWHTRYTSRAPDFSPGCLTLSASC